MEEQGSNHGGGGGELRRMGIHVGEWRSRAPTIVEVTGVGMVWFDVGEWRSKAPTMVSVREVHVAFCLMLGNGRARLQP